MVNWDSLARRMVKLLLPFAVLFQTLALPMFVTAAENTARRNVLFIVSDDLNNFLGCYGDQHAQTPNLDRLAARGVLFERAYCTYPLCGPSRNSFLTGLYPNSTGIHANSLIFRQTIPHHRSLPQAFRLSGYFAARIGKLYHYNVPRSIGTNGHDDPGSWELELNPAGADRLVDEPHIFSLRPGEFGGTLSWYASPNPADRHTDGLMAADANWVLERCATQTDRPFFLALGFYRPHTPYVAPREFFDQFPLEQIKLVEGVEEDQRDLPAAALGSHKKEQERLTDDLRRQAKRAYYASISFMDAQLGKVIDSLDRLGLSDNTVIVFTSDHGYHIGEHGLWQKRSLFEESARVPLLIVAPGMSRNARAISPVSQLDLYPTLAELCDVKAPDNLQGQSLVPMLKDPQATGRGWALTQVNRNANEIRLRTSPDDKPRPQRFSGYSLRTHRWRYTEWDEGRQGRELYDHEKDPRELTNLADQNDYAELITQLSTQLHDAVRASFPPNGMPPKIATGNWAPNLTDP